MATYLSSLSAVQKSNIDFIIKRMAEKEITNAFIQAGILAVISKESSFIPKSESGYGNTANSRIRNIFGIRVADLDENELTTLKKDPKAFFDKIYGGRYHNAADEGYKYRGRGFNQLTFKANYKKVNPFTTVDIVEEPDRMNELPVATDALIGFFKREFSKVSAKLSAYNMTDINDAKNTIDAVGVAYHANTGWGKSKAQIERDTTGGHKKAVDRVNEFYAITSTFSVIKGKEKKTLEIVNTGVVTASSLSVRKGAGTSYSKVKNLKKGAKVNIYKSKGKWLRISIKKEWVSAKYIAIDKKQIPKENPSILPIKFSKRKTVAKAKELQIFLNTFKGIELVEDGNPGKKTSAAFKVVFGYYLIGDARG